MGDRIMRKRHFDDSADNDSACSFHILSLFTEFFQFGFEGYYVAGDEAVVGFGADGVGFAVHFLGEEIKDAANGFFGFAAIVELLEMTLQASEFLGDVGAVSEI